MFAYCNNNPGNSDDYSGSLPKFSPEYLDEFGTIVDTIEGMLFYVREFTKKGDLYEHWVRDDGNPVHSRHHSNHGNGKEHPLVPHDHKWDDDGNGHQRQDKNGQPPDPGFQSPSSGQMNSVSQFLINTGSAVACGYLIYVGVKWAIAGATAPVTGGSSLIVAGVMP